MGRELKETDGSMFARITRDPNGRFDAWLNQHPPVFSDDLGAWYANLHPPIAVGICATDLPEEIRDKPGGKDGWPVKVRLAILAVA